MKSLNPTLFLLSFSFCSLVNGTLPHKILLAHSHRQSTRLRSALVMRCLRIHGFVFCKYTISLPCFFKRWETMLFPQRLMQEWQETGCNILYMTRHTLSVLHRERWRFLISGYPACFVSYRSPCSHEVWLYLGQKLPGNKSVLLGYIWCASAMICDTSVRFWYRTM